MPRVSVIIPTYNRAQLVSRAVYSAYRQSCDDWEIRVVDDCSSDDTESRLQKLSQRLPGLSERLVYTKLDKNRGANVARNVGIASARGKYLAFLDSDDVWHPLKLERHLNVMREQPEGPVFSFSGRYRVDGEYKVIVRQLPTVAHASEQALRAGNGIGPLSAVMVDAEIARSIGGFDEHLAACQDWDFYIRAAPLCRVLAISEPLIMYCDGGQPRISRGGRARIAAHVAMYRKHQKGKVPLKDLAPLYRSVAEDLEGLGKHILAERFYVTSKWLRGSYGSALAVALGFRKMSILAERYDNYLAQERRRGVQAGDDTYLRGFREILAASVE